MLAIVTKGLRRSFTSRKGTVEAVRGVDLEVESGQIYGFLGPNGAGKTTTLRMLATLLVPTAGEAQVAGADLRTEPGRVRERIGYVSQSGGADPRATGRENLELQARLFGASQAEAAARTTELAGRFGLTDFLERIVSGYSGGQRRRLDLALGMVHRPALLFLDEPTIGLDPQSRANLWDEVRALRGAGTTVFLTTHYLDEADELCDRLAIIDEGRIVAEGTPDALKRAIGGDLVTIGVTHEAGARERAAALVGALPGVQEVLQVEPATLRVRTTRGDALLPDVLRAMDAQGLAIQTLALARPSLDDVFLRQTGRSLREEA